MPTKKAISNPGRYWFMRALLELRAAQLQAQQRER